MQGHIYRKKSSDGSWSRWYAVIDQPGGGRQAAAEDDHA